MNSRFSTFLRAIVKLSKTYRWLKAPVVIFLFLGAAVSSAAEGCAKIFGVRRLGRRAVAAVLACALITSTTGIITGFAAIQADGSCDICGAVHDSGVCPTPEAPAEKPEAPACECPRDANGVITHAPECPQYKEPVLTEHIIEGGDCPDLTCKWHYPNGAPATENESPTPLTLADLVNDYGIQAPKAGRSAAAANPITLVQTIDNEDNEFSGNPDGDIDEYLYYTNSVHPIELSFTIDKLPTQSAYLAIKAYDVDEDSSGFYGPEIDRVYLNNDVKSLDKTDEFGNPYSDNMIGKLSGTNDTWNTTVLKVPLNKLQLGKNFVSVVLPLDGWAVEIDWMQLVLDGGTDDPNIDTFSIVLGTPTMDSTTITIPAKVDIALAAGNTAEYITEYSLNDSKGNTLTAFFGTAKPNEVTTLTMPKNSESGTYNIMGIIRDKATEEIKATDDVSFDFKTGELPVFGPKLRHTLSPATLTTEPVKITIEAGEPSLDDVMISYDGVDISKLPASKTVSENGVYEFTATRTVNGAPQATPYRVTVDNITGSTPPAAADMNGEVKYANGKVPDTAKIEYKDASGAVQGGTTAVNGKFTFTGIPDGAYGITVTAADQTVTATVTLSGGKGVITDVTGGTVQGAATIIIDKPADVVKIEKDIDKLPAPGAADITDKTAVTDVKDSFDKLAPAHKEQIDPDKAEKLDELIRKLADVKAKVNAEGSGIVISAPNLEKLMGLAVSAEELKTADKITIELVIKNETSQKPNEDKFKAAAGGQTLGTFLDISILKTVTVGASDDISNITNAPQKVKMVIDIPSDMTGGSDYKVLRLHDGAVDALETTQSGSKLTFESDKFSTYAIAYTKAGGGGQTGGGSGSTPSRSEEYLNNIEQTLKNADSAVGETITISGDNITQLPAAIIDAVRNNKNNTLIIKRDSKDDIIINYKNAPADDGLAIYYTIDELEVFAAKSPVKLTDTAAVTPEAPAKKAPFNPETGGAPTADTSSPERIRALLCGLRRGDVSPDWAPDIAAHRREAEELKTLYSAIPASEKLRLSSAEIELLQAYINALEALR